MNKIKFALLDNGLKSTAPTRKHSTDAGIDLYSAEFDYSLYPNEIKIFRTFVTTEIPKGYFGWITNKSRNDFLVGGGIVDQNYQGELLIKLINPTESSIEIPNGMAIAQLILLPCATPEVELVGVNEIHKEKTDRGSSGGIVRQVIDPDRSFYEEFAEEMDMENEDFSDAVGLIGDGFPY